MAVATNQPPIISPRRVGWGDLRDEREPHRAEHQLAQRDHAVGPMIHQGETRPVSPPARSPGRQDQEGQLVSSIPRPILVGVDGSRPFELEPAPESHQRDRQDDDPERVDGVGDHARDVRAVDQVKREDLDQDRGHIGGFPVGVIIGPVSHRAAVLVEHHPEDDHDPENHQQGA